MQVSVPQRERETVFWHSLAVVFKHKKAMDVFASIIPFENSVQLPRFHTKAGEQFIDLGRIVYLKAQLNYTVFYLLDGEQVVTSLSLSTYARLLEPCGFVRLHKSCLLNGQYLSRCEVIENQLLILPDRQQVTIARRRKAKIFQIKQGKNKASNG
jgi:two-component system LytT family response regulator